MKIRLRSLDQLQLGCQKVDLLLPKNLKPYLLQQYLPKNLPRHLLLNLYQQSRYRLERMKWIWRTSLDLRTLSLWMRLSALSPNEQRSDENEPASCRRARLLRPCQANPLRLAGALKPPEEGMIVISSSPKPSTDSQK